MIRHTVELLQSSFGKTPKALNPVDMTAAHSELIVAVLHSEMFGIADIDQPIVTSSSIAVNRHLNRHAASYDGLQRGFLAIGHDLGVDTTVSLKQSKNRCLASGSATALASNTTRAKIAFIDFDFATLKRRSALTRLRNARANLEINAVDAFALQTRQNSDVRRG